MDWHAFFVNNRVEGRNANIVWFATIWVLCATRNGACFRKEPWNVNNVVWSVKWMAWRWSLWEKNSHSFYEFCMDPVFYLS